MITAGFDVDPTDGTPEIARIAEERLGRPVRVMHFDKLVPAWSKRLVGSVCGSHDTDMVLTGSGTSQYDLEGGFIVPKVRDDPAMVALIVLMNLSSGTEREPMVRGLSPGGGSQERTRL
jgi:hypothetical protein